MARGHCGGNGGQLLPDAAAGRAELQLCWRVIDARDGQPDDEAANAVVEGMREQLEQLGVYAGATNTSDSQSFLRLHLS